MLLAVSLTRFLAPPAFETVPYMANLLGPNPLFCYSTAVLCPLVNKRTMSEAPLPSDAIGDVPLRSKCPLFNNLSPPCKLFHTLSHALDSNQPPTQVLASLFPSVFHASLPGARLSPSKRTHTPSPSQ